MHGGGHAPLPGSVRAAFPQSHRQAAWVKSYLDRQAAASGMTLALYWLAEFKGWITAEQSASGILQVLEGNEELSGRFFSYDGSEIPW